MTLMPEQSLGQHSIEKPLQLDNSFFRIIALGSFNHDNYQVRQNEQRTYSSNIQNDIRIVWQKVNKERGGNDMKVLTNDPQLGLASIRVEDGTIIFDTALSSYKDQIAWQDKEFRQKYPDFNPNILGTNILIGTSDNKLMIVQRSFESATEPGTMSIAGGQPDINNDCDENGIWDPFKTVTRELEEETGVKKDELKEVEMKSVVFNKVANNPTVLFFAVTDLSSDEIKQRTTDREVNVRFINDEQQKIEHTILWWSSSKSPSGSSALSIYGSGKFGLDWLEKINNRLIRRDQRFYSKLSPSQLRSIVEKASGNLSKK
jgi:8-oxo-dGTP pyrophosphatase MutT (NUDIX family)